MQSKLNYQHFYLNKKDGTFEEVYKLEEFKLNDKINNKVANFCVEVKKYSKTIQKAYNFLTLFDLRKNANIYLHEKFFLHFYSVQKKCKILR